MAHTIPTIRNIPIRSSISPAVTIRPILIRPVAQAQSRLKEAQKLGFDQAYCPEGNLKDGATRNFAVTGLPELGDFIAKISAKAGAGGNA